MSKVQHYINKGMAYAKNNKNMVLVAVAIVAIVITGGLVYVNKNHGFTLPPLFGVSDAQIGKNAIAYINSSGLTSTPATLVGTSEADGLVKVTIKIGTSQFDSYVTKDGKLLFPQAFDMTAKTASSNTTANATPSATAATITKTDKPMLEAFVVSSCPFGLQMQRAMAEAVRTQPALAASMVVRYIGSVSNGQITSMHDAAPGGGEAQENLRQICIREEQPAKYWSYVSCYMQKSTGTLPNGMPLGDSPSCQASTGVDTAKLNACVSDPARGLAYAQKDFNEDTKYNVTGSPTLVLDGTTIDETSFGGRSADAMRAIICAASTTQPGFCSTKLNTAEASTSFAVSYASSTGSASSSAANCAPAQ